MLTLTRIPTQKDELFAYPLDWSVLDKDLMERRVKSWINKKIVEYIGEEEPSLCGFICSKVLAKSQPENILQDVAIVSALVQRLLWGAWCPVSKPIQTDIWPG